jgi:transcriptional regulator with XRE-family HTH domain
VKSVRELRYSRGLTQKQLARMLGMSVITVSLWGTRNAAPKLRRRYEISQMFGAPMEGSGGRATHSH